MITPHPNLERVGKRIRAARQEKNLTQEQLADMLGCSVPSVQNLEQGREDSDISILYLLSALLNKSCDYFFRDETPEEYEERICQEILYRFTLLSPAGMERLRQMLEKEPG